MINNSYCCYNEYLDRFEIRSSQPTEVVCKKECNYGIELQFDINMQLIGIIIPEPDILFGINSSFLRNFICNNLT